MKTTQGPRAAAKSACTELLSITEVARRLSCSRDTVERIVDRGELPIVDIGIGRAKTRIRCSELEAWIAGRERRIGTPA